MRRHENLPARPTAGCLSVPLFNQKKRSRMPLTSNPSENCSNDYMTTTNSSNSASGCYQASGYPATAPQSQQWNRQGDTQYYQQPRQYGSNRPAPGPAPTVKTHSPLPHPYKSGNTSSQMGHPKNSVRQQDSRSVLNPRQNNYQAPHNCGSTQSKPTCHSDFSQMGQQPADRQANLPKHHYTQQSRPPPSLPSPSRSAAHAPKSPNTSWKFKCTNNFELQRAVERNSSAYCTQTLLKTQAQTPHAFQIKPAIENSLRILTAFIDGMRHWSQFKDRAPYLFEIFATLDSAVTVGSHGAKNFLMRDGKDVMQCVFYENEKELPRLIRGQVHRCVGNYDRTRDILVCVSVRAGLPSEQRNAQETVKACDVEMRALVKSLSEI